MYFQNFTLILENSLVFFVVNKLILFCQQSPNQPRMKTQLFYFAIFVEQLYNNVIYIRVYWMSSVRTRPPSLLCTLRMFQHVPVGYIAAYSILLLFLFVFNITNSDLKFVLLFRLRLLTSASTVLIFILLTAFQHKICSICHCKNRINSTAREHFKPVLGKQSLRTLECGFPARV